MDEDQQHSRIEQLLPPACQPCPACGYGRLYLSVLDSSWHCSNKTCKSDRGHVRHGQKHPPKRRGSGWKIEVGLMMISKTCFATVVGSFLLLACTCARADSFTLGFSAGSASADATGLINFSWASDGPAGYSLPQYLSCGLPPSM